MVKPERWTNLLPWPVLKYYPSISLRRVREVIETVRKSSKQRLESLTF
jgi:hypothetical protein